MLAANRVSFSDPLCQLRENFGQSVALTGVLHVACDELVSTSWTGPQGASGGLRHGRRWSAGGKNVRDGLLDPQPAILGRPCGVDIADQLPAMRWSE